MAPARPSFSAVHRAHFRDVARWIRLLGVPERDVEAVAQEVFADVYASLDKYDPTRPLAAWLRAIAARRALDYLGSARHRRESPAALEEDTMPADTHADPERHARLADAQRILIELLRELKDDLRAVFVMHEIEQLTIPEIATTLGINDNTVRSRLHRARQAFDEAYARRGGKIGEMPAIAPIALLEAGRAPFGDGDRAMAARVWSRLERLFGLGIVGPLAALSSSQIVGAGALIFVLGAGAGALLARAPASAPAPVPLARAAALAPSSTAAARAAARVDVAAIATPAPMSASTAQAEDAGAPEQSDTLRMEQGYLDRAWDLFNSGDAVAAQRELDRHELLYPGGALAGKRRSLRQQIMADLAGRDGGPR